MFSGVMIVTHDECDAAHSCNENDAAVNAVDVALNHLTLKPEWSFPNGSLIRLRERRLKGLLALEIV